MMNHSPAANVCAHMFRIVLPLALLALLAPPVQPAPIAQAAIAEARYQSIGGVEQWITIRGANAANPVLLFLHGGPGDIQSPLPDIYRPLEQNFVLVQWDQRGAGRTLARAGMQQPVSLEQLTRDAIELAEYLRGHLHTTNLTIVGHSWGSYLGVHTVKRRPDLFRAFVGTGQVVSWSDTVSAEYRFTLDRARASGNQGAVADLERLNGPPRDDFDRYLILRRYLNMYLADADRRWIREQERLLKNTLTADEWRAYWQGFERMSGMTATVLSMDVTALGMDFNVPFFIIDGAEDRIAPSDLAGAYLQQVRAPAKRMTLIPGAGHFAPMTHAPEFAAELLKNLRRLTR
jgi:pimeloyl-ACP methyl ester carboxylesterase